MNINKQNFDYRKTLVSLAVLAACAPVYAQDAMVAELIRPESSISVGVVGTNSDQRDRSLMGQYNGLRDNSTFGQVDMDINKRDDATGTSWTLKGRNLGLDNRDLSVTHEKQGDWKYGLDYSELVRHDPRTVNTGMLNAGSTTPSVVRLATPGSGVDQNFQLKRVGLGLEGSKWISPNLQFEVNFKNEDKTGSRLYGKGYACAAYVCGTANNATAQSAQSSSNQLWALLMLAEPVNSTTKQLEAKLNYSRDNLNFSAGYYGSFFNGANGSFRATVPGQLNSPTGALSTLAAASGASVIPGGGMSLQDVLQLPMALQPDNQAHQFYVSGSYRINPTTNGTFKYAYTHATQNEDFASMGLANAPAGVTNLGAVVDTTLIQLGLTARPIPKLSLLANVRYENKDDKTPLALYSNEAIKTSAAAPAILAYTNVGSFWNNATTSATKVAGKLEASYQLPAELRGTIGLDYNSQEREVPTDITEDKVAGLGALRAKNQESGYRLELRRTMSETLTGAMGYTNSKRSGSDWTSLLTSSAAIAAGLNYGQTGTAAQFLALSAGNAFPMNMVDVDREKIKLSANWAPTDKVDVQFNVEDGKDKNSTAFNAIALGKAWRESSNTQYSIDASFAVSDNWKVNGYASQGNQNLKINHSTGYMADLATRSDGFGFGMNGKINAKLNVGAQVTYLNDTTKYGLSASPTTTGTLPNITQVSPTAANLAQVALGLPDVRFQTTTINLYGTYAVDKKSSIRVNLMQQKASLDEWTWSNNGSSFVYSDNTTVNMNQNQDVTFLGVAYIYKF